jgi:hypothetical protein
MLLLLPRVPPVLLLSALLLTKLRKSLYILGAVARLRASSESMAGDSLQ